MAWRGKGFCRSKWLFHLVAAASAALVLLCAVGCKQNLQAPPKFLQSLQPAGEFGLDSAEGIALSLRREILVADTWHDRLVTISLDHRPGKTETEKAWGEFGIAPGQFSAPCDVAVDERGNIYVSDSWNHRIQRFSPEGKLLAHWGKKANIWDLKKDELYYPKGIAVDTDGNVYVADSADHRIIKYSPEGKVLFVVGEEGKTALRFHIPLDVATDLQDNLYITDSGNHRIQKLTSNGEYVNRWGEEGRKPGQFNRPSGVAVDREGRVYVVDSGNHRVQVFDSAGKLLTLFGKRGKGPGEFESPESIAIGPDGKIYVLDWGNNRIQVFQP